MVKPHRVRAAVTGVVKVVSRLVDRNLESSSHPSLFMLVIGLDLAGKTNGEERGVGLGLGRFPGA
jgi:hypothetical protein